MIKVICKIYWSAVQFAIPPYAENPTDMNIWIELFKPLLSKRLHEACEGIEPLNQPLDEDERTNWPWWKIKRWIMQILCRLFARWGNPKQVSDEHVAISNYIRSTVAPSVLGTVLETLALRKSGCFCPDRVVQLSLVFIQNAIEPSMTYKLIKPHLPFLLFEVVHPVLCLTQKDLDEWVEDPYEFVRRSHDFFEDFCDPVVAASTLLCDLAKKRGKDCLPLILGFYNDILTNYNQSPAHEKKYIQKDAALHAFHSMASTLTASDAHKEAVEPMLIQHVIPEFANPQGYLRLRACRLFSGNFMRNIEFKDQQTLVHIVHGVLKCMQDEELPVRIEAAKTLRTVVMYEHSDTIKDVIRPMLHQILEQFFKLMEEMGNDEVIMGLEMLIDQFAEEIGPYSIQLVEKLVDCFTQFCATADEDDDASMAALQCLDAINTILLSIHMHPEYYGPLSLPLIPILQRILRSEDGIEYLDSALEILGTLSYFSLHISSELWSVFPMLFLGFQTWSWDYIATLVTVIDNFVGKDMEGFVIRKITSSEGQELKYSELVFNMAHAILITPQADTLTKCSACRLFYSLLHNCFGQVDAFIAPIVHIVCSQVMIGKREEEDDSIWPLYLNVLTSAIYYNPLLALGAMEKSGHLEMVFREWFSKHNATAATDTTPVEDGSLMVDQHTLLNDKLDLLGMTSILSLPVTSLPSLLQSNLKPIVVDAAKALQNYIQCEQQIEKRRHEAEERGGVDDSDDTTGKESSLDMANLINAGGYGSDEDVEGFEDEEYADLLMELQYEAQSNTNFLGDLGGDFDDDDDYSSALDRVDPVIYFVEVVSGKSNTGSRITNIYAITIIPL